MRATLATDRRPGHWSPPMDRSLETYFLARLNRLRAGCLSAAHQPSPARAWDRWWGRSAARRQVKVCLRSGLVAQANLADSASTSRSPPADRQVASSTHRFPSGGGIAYPGCLFASPGVVVGSPRWWLVCWRVLPPGFGLGSGWMLGKWVWFWIRT